MKWIKASDAPKERGKYFVKTLTGGGWCAYNPEPIYGLSNWDMDNVIEWLDESPSVPEAAEKAELIETVSDLFFEAAISKAFDNRQLVIPSMQHFIGGGNLNGEFLFILKKLMRWSEKKAIEAGNEALALYQSSPVKSDAEEFAEWMIVERFYRSQDEWVSLNDHYSGYQYTTEQLYTLFIQSKKA